MRIAAGEFWHETHTFSTVPTTLAHFDLREGDGLLQSASGTRTTLGGFVDAARRHGFTLAPTLAAGATPSGMVTRDAFHQIEDRLVARFAACGPVDGLLLSLHGGMVAEGVDDAEGHLLARLRDLYGPAIPIVTTLDLHANISPLMATLADALVGYDTHPHVDIYERAVEAAEILLAILAGRIRPTAALAKPPILAVGHATYTERPPMRDLVARAHEIESDPRVVSVTVSGGYAYADIPKAGMGFVVTTNGDRALAEAYARKLGDQAWRARDGFVVPKVPVADAVRRAVAAARGPVLLVDVGDNIGGGSPGDGTVLLQALLQAGARDAVVVLADPQAVQQATAAGVGAEVSLTAGGKTDALHGSPVPVTGRVRLLSDGDYVHKGPYMTGQTTRMGKTCVLRCQGVTLALTERKTPPFDAQQLRSLGIEPADQKILVAKSAIAWRAAFGDLAAEVIDVDTPGLGTGDLSRFPYRNLRRPIFPLDSFTDHAPW